MENVAVKKMYVESNGNVENMIYEIRGVLNAISRCGKTLLSRNKKN